MPRVRSVHNHWDAEQLILERLLSERVDCALSAYGLFDASMLLERRLQFGKELRVPSSPR